MSSASKIFQKTIEHDFVVSKIHTVINLSGNFIIWSCGEIKVTQKEHDKALDHVLLSLIKSGLMMNLPKCLFSV